MRTALADVRGMVAAMTAALASADDDPRNVYKVGQNTTRLLLAAGDLLVGYLLLRQAAVALRALDAGGVGPADQRVLRGQGRRGALLRRVRPARTDALGAWSPSRSTTP